MITITNPIDLHGLCQIIGPRFNVIVPQSVNIGAPEPYTIFVQRPLDIPMMMVGDDGQVVQPSITLRVVITRDVLAALLQQMGQAGIANDPDRGGPQRGGNGGQRGPQHGGQRGGGDGGTKARALGPGDENATACELDLLDANDDISDMTGGVPYDDSNFGADYWTEDDDGDQVSRPQDLSC